MRSDPTPAGDIARFSKAFLAFEKDHHLFDLTVEDRPYWDYVRHHLYQDLLVQKGLMTPPHFPSATLPYRNLLNKISKFARDIPKLALETVRISIQKRRYDIVFFDAAVHKLCEGKYQNIYFYPLYQALKNEASVLVVEDRYVADQRDDAPEWDTANIRCFVYLAKLKTLFYRYTRKQIAEFQEIDSLIANEFGCMVSSATYVTKHFLWNRFLSTTLEKLFSQWQPSLIGYTDNGNKKGVVDAARRVGILSFEMQHGCVSPLEIHVTYPDLPKGKLIVPDIVLTFGRYWNQKHQLPSEKMVVGFWWFEQHYKKCASQSPRDPNAIIGISVMDKQFATAFLNAARKLPDFTFYYKLRPEEYACWRDLYPELKNLPPNFHMIDNDRIHLYAYLSSVTYVISTSSTALYEGVCLGCHALIFPGFLHEMVWDLVEEGYAVLVKDDERLVNALTQRVVPSMRADTETFFAFDSQALLRASYRMMLSLAGA
jgi:hypothetical protein